MASTTTTTTMTMPRAVQEWLRKAGGDDVPAPVLAYLRRCVTAAANLEAADDADHLPPDASLWFAGKSKAQRQKADEEDRNRAFEMANRLWLHYAAAAREAGFTSPLALVDTIIRNYFDEDAVVAEVYAMAA
jgi:hypothetical protein